MPFPQPIHAALENYDKNKGFWRRLFRHDQVAIRALRRLNETDQANFLKIYCCFIENKPKDTQKSYQVYRDLLNYLASLDCEYIPDTLDLLHSNQLLNSINLEELNPLTRDDFRKFANLLNNLNAQHLLTQFNFDQITECFENKAEENLSEILKNLATSVDKLHKDNLLTQENLNCLLEKPEQAENIANILLDQNYQFTFDNYLTQKGNEMYVDDLISKDKLARRHTFERYFSTAPSLRINNRSMISNLNLTRDRPGTF